MKTLGKIVSKGAIWSLADIVFNKASYFLVMLYLARVLGPEEFGIIGMIILFVNMGNALVDSGMSTSILRMPEPDEDDYSTVFLTNLLISILVYAILFFSASYIASFYKEPILVDVIRLYTLGFLIYAFKAVRLTRLSKNLDFKRIAILNIPGIIISSIVGIVMADQGYGVFSLVGLYLANQTVSALLFNLFTRPRVKVKFVPEKWRFHFKFGYKLMLSAQINIIFDNIYNVWIGKAYTKRELGFFERSQTFNSYPSQIVVELFSKVSLPAFANVKNDTERFERAYKKVMMMAFFIMCSMMAIVAALAEPVFALILGEEWLPAVPYFRILVLAYIFYPVHSMNINLLSIFDRSDLYLKIEVIKKVVAISTLVFALLYGINGLLWSIVLTGFISLFINSFYSEKLINYGFMNQIRDMLPIMFVSGLAFVLLFYIQTEFSSTQLWPLIGQCLMGIGFTVIANLVFKRKPFYDLLATFRILISK